MEDPRSGPGVPDAARRWSRILVPVDFSLASMKTLSYAAQLGEFLPARWFLIHVLGEPSGLPGVRRVPDWVNRHTPAAAMVEAQVGLGRPAPTFLQAARHLKAHLIVMGPQQWSGWRRLRAAGAIRRILSETPCPILSVPQRSAR